MILHFIFISYLSLQRYYSFLSTALDLGIFNQAFWTTLFEGQFFYETPDFWFNPKGCFFGVHFSPILFLLLPIYALYPHPETLLVIQAFFISLTIIPLYFLAKIKIRKYSLVVLFLYVVYAPAIFLALFDFHLEALIPALLLFTIYFYEKKEFQKYFIFLLLSLSVIEFVPILTATYALYNLLREFASAFKAKNLKKVVKQKSFIVSVLTLFLSVFWLFLSLFIKSVCNPYAHPLPSSFAHITNPRQWYLIPEYLRTKLDEKLLYIIELLGPLVFLPILGLPELFPAFAWIILAYLTDYVPYFQITYQYNGFVIPFIFYAFIKGLERISLDKVLRKMNKNILKKALLLSVVVSMLFSSYAWTKYKADKRIFGHYDPQHLKLLQSIIALIPPDVSILTQNDIFPHVSNRKNVFLSSPNETFEPDFILIDIKLEFYKSPPPYPPYIIFLPNFLRKHRNYGIYAEADGIVLYKLNWTGSPVFYEPYVRILTYKELKLGTGHTAYDKSSYSKRILVHTKHDATGVFWFGPYELFPPGTYEVIFRLKVSEIVNETILILDVATNLGSKILAQVAVNGTQFQQPNQWENVTLTFTINVPLELEIRGIWASNITNIYLDYILVKQIAV